MDNSLTLRPVFFSDFFEIDEKLLDDYGAVNISLINDLPLFIDPFLLFESDKAEYREIHENMIKYLLFIKEIATGSEVFDKGKRSALFCFPEIKQTWLGFSLNGNSGRGLGIAFADELFSDFKTRFRAFGERKISLGVHMEQLCLSNTKIGKDKISDFTTKFALDYLLRYTETFALKYLKPDLRRKVSVPGAVFNWTTKRWAPKTYELPFVGDDYVILTPRDILTRGDTFINRNDMLHKMDAIAEAMSDCALKSSLLSFLSEELIKKETEQERTAAKWAFIYAHPEVILNYIRFKEDRGPEAQKLSLEQVEAVRRLFHDSTRLLVTQLEEGYWSSARTATAYDEAKRCAMVLKHIIEDQDGYQFFYDHGKPIRRESDVQLLYRFASQGSSWDFNREVNNGRGPVDYKVSKGSADAAVVEMKLASNSGLKRNLKKQVDIYKKASETKKAVVIIVCFSSAERSKVEQILEELSLQDKDYIVLIDAWKKPSASKATEV